MPEERSDMLTPNALREIAERAIAQRARLSTEEAAKQALVLPLIQALGYDIFDPTEIVPEFTADYGHKKGEKVDYAIMCDGQPAILIECKAAGDLLDRSHASQLGRYFHTTTTAYFAVLTNGIVYKFFSDLDADNVMDVTPFYEVDITRADDHDIGRLNHFAKQTFDMKQVRMIATDMKCVRGIKAYLRQINDKPSDQFVRLLMDSVCPNMKKTQVNIDRITMLSKQAFREFINDCIENIPNPEKNGVSSNVREGSVVSNEDCNRIPLTEVNEGEHFTQKPIAVQFPDEKEIKIDGYWVDTLRCISDWLGKKGCQLITADTRYFVTESQPEGKRHHEVKCKGKTIYILINASIKNLMIRNQKLLEACNIDPKSVFVIMS